MGLAWSNPIQIRDSQMIYTKIENQQLFDIWRNYKIELRKDGFRLMKYGSWQIELWKKDNEDIYDCLNELTAKWLNILEPN